ncbi:hypothetical protein N5C66_29915 [Rhizobium pusense]|uniref:hypothetical protein n=1 Tax=Agrobacterium pusense TaxID=648995 RepID=UPI0024495591|nr:hypothetical protein [Agrobacterium pusense]MDH1099340.1 hypothetical protein [Agrobacterium pusense]MDH1115898.1 hypothetical protein [Agrobacterium pusense]MDH2197622.1 hypothetical protein [Agrobacterium pusense]
MNFRNLVPLVGLLVVAGCSDSPESNFQKAYNAYKNGDYPVHDVACQKWDTSAEAKNYMYSCDFKYMYLPWMSQKKEERSDRLILLNAIGTKDWWISRNQ